MSECKLDHSTEDVKKKLAEQSGHLPEDIRTALETLLDQPLEQERLNQVFHLLKKYDLATVEERQERDVKFRALV
ncbi:hypothetical protein ACQCN2_04705 [Brevibacillus ginsengisoli]|uniref:hypothetical protein n=1 Tax=Brevibacillus ginsengisoli TaxID=363854 RepID=UPI003CEDC41A